ncbi:UDP-glucose 4-epimerase [Vibrio chagasii]|nr:UDP-glucose 4-epimerase [Vibrio chagasii]CAH6942517.1 UDP-glucose 4-epimerase [Vibrio chagasii]CAH7396427.1 UDP-glucose 4-epimerase [Vibrio chagasii]CAH7416685.1 UDP-glucose 4-epimerase [Vibrio chagasii]CAH7423519.1 UDP-glucose 4-epimerase [Vibrio chagasii]
MNKILLTGSSGFIGSHLLQNCPLPIVSVKRSAEKNSTSDTFYIASLDKGTSWSGAFRGISTVVHLAAVAHSKRCSIQSVYDVNVEGTVNLAKSAAHAGVKRFIFLSSIGVLGGYTEKGNKFSKESPVQAGNTYTKSKLEAEKKLRDIEKDTGMEVVIIRAPLVYGQNAPGSFSQLKKLVSIVPLLPFGCIDNRRDFISVDNLVDLISCCCQHPNAAGQTFLASDDYTLSLRQFISYIADGLGKRCIQIPIPVFVYQFLAQLFKKHKLMEQLVLNLEIDISDTKKSLNWIPPYHPQHTMGQLKRGLK